MILDGKKAATICILKILEEYTDAEHRLTQQEIINKLKSEYSISLERKAVASSLDILAELGYSIDRNSNLGVCLMEHKFDTSEVSYLIDAIFSSKSLTAKEAKKLSDKVSSLVSEHDRKKYDFIYKSNDVNRRDIDDEFFGVLATIEYAIKEKKMIKFKVLEYDDKGSKILKHNSYLYSFYPYFIVNNFGKYYCLGFDNKMTFRKYRIEYIWCPTVEDEDAPDLHDIPGFETFDIAKYINTHVYMFDGAPEKITLLLERKSVIKVVKDWFGKSSKIYTKDGNIYADIVACPTDVEFWLLQYIEDIKVVAPKELQDSIKMRLKRNLDRYNVIGTVGVKKRLNLQKILKNAMETIDKNKELVNCDENEFATKFKEYLEKFITKEHEIEVKGKNLEINIGNNEDEKALVVLSFKKNEATDDDFFDLLKDIEKAQEEEDNYLETYAVALVHGLSYYKVKYKTDEARFFDYRETQEITKPIKHGKEKFIPLHSVKIKWASPITDKLLKFYIIKG